MYRRNQEFRSEAKVSARRLKRKLTNQTSYSPPSSQQRETSHSTIFAKGISREKNNMFISSQATPEHIGPGFYRVQPMDKIYKNVDNLTKSAMRLASRNAYTGTQTNTANNKLSKSMMKMQSLPTIAGHGTAGRFQRKKMSRSKMEKQPQMKLRQSIRVSSTQEQFNKQTMENFRKRENLLWYLNSIDGTQRTSGEVSLGDHKQDSIECTLRTSMPDPNRTAKRKFYNP